MYKETPFPAFTWKRNRLTKFSGHKPGKVVSCDFLYKTRKVSRACCRIWTSGWKI